MYNVAILVEVSSAAEASFISLITKEWNKLPTILFTENVIKPMACSINIRPILTW